MLPDFRVRQRDYLLEIGRALTQELDLDTLLGRILGISIELLAGHAGLIALRSESGEWVLRVSHGLPAPFLRLLEPLLSDLTPNENEQEDFGLSEINQLLKELTFAASLGLLTGVGLPMVARESLVGVIFIFRNYPGVFSSNDRALLSAFASQAAIAVQNAQLYSQVMREKQRLDGLLDSAGDGILIITPSHRIERCNPAFARMLDLPVQNINDRIHSDIIVWAQPPNGITLEQAQAGGWPLTPHAQLYIEGDLKRGNPGTPALPVGITYAPLMAVDGGLLGVIATVRDITRFRQAEELKSTFISIVSHELKTPVALIKGYVSTLRREDAQWDQEIVADSLQVIEEEADRLGQLIENLLEASRLQSGGLTLQMTEVNLAELATRISKRLQSQTTRHKIEVNFSPDLPLLMVSEERLEQVFSNLINNAIKYSPGGAIRITAELHQDVVVVCVSDEGPGISQQDIPYVFDRFYRSPETSRRTKGAGLGLYLTKAIVEAHGGRIWINPTPGKGAQICFSLPLQKESGPSELNLD